MHAASIILLANGYGLAINVVQSVIGITAERRRLTQTFITRFRLVYKLIVALGAAAAVSLLLSVLI